MYKINSHPILCVPKGNETTFLFNGKKVTGLCGLTIAAALHQAGYPIHTHSIDNRKRSLSCGIGKCGACEMLVDGSVKRICVTKVDGVKEVKEIEKGSLPQMASSMQTEVPIYKTQVLIVGAGPAGLAVRESLNEFGIENIVVDANDKIGGQFVMQTHQFFFFEQQHKFGGMRGFDIAKTLAGENHKNIFLNSSVWDILQGNRIGVKNTLTGEIFYIDCQHLVVATGAVPFMPVFKNDDVPGVYTAAVVQKMMNDQFTLLGKNILTVGAGNIGYLTSYQAMQAGAKVVAIVEGMNKEGGFPVQANRVRRLGIPILTSTIVLEAIPNKKGDGLTGAIIACCENFKPIAGTERIINNIDLINVCTGLLPDNQLLTKGKILFGEKCHGVGDSTRIGEGTSAVLRGKQCAYEIAQMLKKRVSYEDYLYVSKAYIESQQKPTPVLKEAAKPNQERMQARAFVRLECLFGFACNPCSFACPQGAITKTSTSTVPQIDYEKCIGCMKCINHCPGLSIFGYNTKKMEVYLPFEYKAQEKAEVYLVDNNGAKLAEGIIAKITKGDNKTSVARITVSGVSQEELLNIKGFILKENYPEQLKFSHIKEIEAKTYVCHCEDVTLEKILKQIGDRKQISIDEIKHTTRAGMGECRGKRCTPRLRQILATYGIEVTDEPTPRAPLSLQLTLADVDSAGKKEVFIAYNHKKVKVDSLVAGGGMAGSSAFRYLADANLNPVLINNERGSSWRCIAGGRPAFSNPELADIAVNNYELFKDLQKIGNIDLYPSRYVNFAHDQESYKGLEKAMEWSDAYMVEPKDFQKEISPYFDPENKNYIAAQITNQCWQATPGKTIDLLRKLGKEKGGTVMESCKLVELTKTGKTFHALVLTHDNQYIEYITDVFVNALGFGAAKFARQIGIETGLYPVKHQAFITKRLPLLGKDGNILDMIIDRRIYKGFSSIYGQQLKETGQIIGCASPRFDNQEANGNLKANTQEFLQISAEVFAQWIPQLKNVNFQALWSGYYAEPRYIIDPDLGLLIGMRGHGFMLSQYFAKIYVDKLMGKKVPAYFNKLRFGGEGIAETALK